MDKASIALIISFFSAVISFWSVYRDRSKLRVKSKFIPARLDYAHDRIWFQTVNCGKRPIYLRMVGGTLTKHGWMGTHIGDSDFGLKLEEGQSYETYWTLDEIHVDGPDFEDDYIDIWLEDSHGKRYKVPNSKAFIKRLRKSNRVAGNL